MDDYKIKYSGKPINKKVDYIRREDVYSLLEDMNYIVRDEKCGDCFKKIERCVEKLLSTANVTPIVHAKWENGKCTNCGAEIPTENKHYLIASNECKYCHSCGAMMGEE